MANKLPWFTHDHNARNDEFIQRAIDKFGHFGYAAYFMLLEVIHEHGTGGTVQMSQSRLALNLRSRWPQVRLYLDFCRTSGKVDFTLSGTEVQLQNKKFIERQAKLKSKTPPTLPESSANTPLYIEREREVDIQPPKSPKGDWPGFEVFWKAYPKRKAKAAAVKAWNRLRPDDSLVAVILTAIENHMKQDSWTRDNGQYIPHPSAWLNGQRWNDEVTAAPAALDNDQYAHLQRIR